MVTLSDTLRRDYWSTPFSSLLRHIAIADTTAFCMRPGACLDYEDGHYHIFVGGYVLFRQEYGLSVFWGDWVSRLNRQSDFDFQIAFIVSINIETNRFNDSSRDGYLHRKAGIRSNFLMSVKTFQGHMNASKPMAEESAMGVKHVLCGMAILSHGENPHLR